MPGPTPALAHPRRARAWARLGAALLLACPALTGCASPASSPVVDQPVTRPLAVPQLDPGHLRPDGIREFDLTARAGRSDFGQAQPTATIGLNSEYLGPTLVAEHGEAVRVNVTNGLAEATTLHWHGMHLPARMDGGPHQMLAPGSTWSPSWQVRQPAATLWYHAHPHGQTAAQVYRGMAGMWIIRDPAEAALGLPDQYGVDDIPLIVQDKRFDRDGQLVFDQQGPSSTGFLGDTIMVNGTIGAYLDVPTERIRLRLLNASTARIYRFGLADDRDFQMIASDGGLLASPVTTNRVQLSPGERAEILVAMAPGERVMLRNHTPDFGSRVGANTRFGAGDFNVVELRAAAELVPGRAPPAQLATIDRLDPAAASTTRTFTINAQIINRRPMALGRIDEVVQLGATEVWVLHNRDPQPHNFHVHNVQFQVLDLDGAPPGPELAGWKDTVYLQPGGTVRIIMAFRDYADPKMPYMYHCHLLWHEDQGLMGQFVVIRPGQVVVPPPVPPDWVGHPHEDGAPARL